MRIKYIVPFPLNEEGIAKRAQQIPREILGEDTVVECLPVKHNTMTIDNYYEALIFEMYLAEAGLRAEEEGFDAVIMDTVSDSALYALRSRLKIPVVGPGLVSYAVAMMLGKKFSILAYLDRHRYLFEKNLDMYKLWDRCASIRVANIEPDFTELFTGDEAVQLTREAQKAIDEDGADVILLGSTTMHQAGAYMSSRVAAPVVNPGPVAIKITESLVQLGLSHSKIAFPGPTSNEDEVFHALPAVADEPDPTRAAARPAHAHESA